MSVDPIGFLPPLQPIQAAIQTGVAPQDQVNFGDWLVKRFDQVNGKLIDAEHQVQRLAVGDVENLHQVMISLEEAKLDFQLALQIRNKLLEAYQDVIRMQV
jgi:flagellar hook-basal body complex protein FliE